MSFPKNDGDKIRILIQTLKNTPSYERILSRHANERKIPLNMTQLPFQQTLVVASPHSDDAALSCGATLLAAANRGSRVIIVTCFSISEYTQNEPDGSDPLRVTRIRIEEDNKFASNIGPLVSLLPLAFEDAPIRRERSWKETCSVSTLTPYETKLQDQLAHVLLSLLNGSTSLLAPSGIGGHVDHRIVSAASRTLQLLGHDVWFYEELPYAIGQAINPPPVPEAPVRLEISHIFEYTTRKRFLLQEYKSQVNQSEIEQITSYGASIAPPKFTEVFWGRE